MFKKFGAPVAIAISSICAGESANKSQVEQTKTQVSNLSLNSIEVNESSNDKIEKIKNDIYSKIGMKKDENIKLIADVT